MSKQDGNFWRNKFTNDLKEWGIEVPGDITYDELKKLYKAEKKTRAEAGEELGPDVPDLNTPDDDEAELFKLFGQFMQQHEAQKGSSVAGMSEKQFEKVLLSVKEGKTDSKGHVRHGWVDPDDRIEPVKFFAPFVRYYVPEKYNGAYAEALPIGVDMLKFIPSFGYSVRVGDRNRRKYVSIMETNSLAVYKYLTGTDLEGRPVGEKHPDFDRVFYIQPEKAFETSDNGMWVQVFKKHEFTLMSRKFSDLLKDAKDKWGLPTNMTWSKEQYAAAIAEKMTEAELGAMLQQQKENLQRRAAEKMLLKQQDNIDASMPTH